MAMQYIRANGEETNSGATEKQLKSFNSYCIQSLAFWIEILLQELICSLDPLRVIWVHRNDPGMIPGYRAGLAMA